MISVLYSPVALWLAEKSPSKACPMGIPYRSYPLQHKIRFWSFFALYEVAFTLGYFYLTLDKDFLEKYRYPLNTIREKKL